GGLELAPTWILEGHDAIIAADIGGTNLRVGIIELKMKKGDISRAAVWKSALWRHKDDDPSRDDAIGRMAEMIEKLMKQADEEKLRVAPFIAIGCPGIITREGTIEKGAQNLPGDWEERDFSLSGELAGRLPLINGHEPPVRDPQRRRRAGPERSGQHAGLRALGRVHHRHRPRQRPLHESQIANPSPFKWGGAPLIAGRRSHRPQHYCGS
ncbi:MAG TPA: hypothetical protein VGM96_15655, partial [Reyranella sp.]